jgi:glycosyltransferase involved in cell wall biosynthesis
MATDREIEQKGGAIMITQPLTREGNTYSNDRSRVIQRHEQSRPMLNWVDGGCISVVIPALNEAAGIADVLQEIPIDRLNRMGYEIEVLVVDNGSTDGTFTIAKSHGARVLIQPVRGYGNAYKAGFANATGDIIATGDADLTYPLSVLPELLRRMKDENLDFINTDRLSSLNPEAMTASHVLGNWLLTHMTRLLFGWPFNDSQSGMWVFKRSILPHLHVESSGMPFSQEIKIEAYTRGFKCAEIPIEYRSRAGNEKLNTVGDGLGNVSHLIKKKLLG